MSNAGVNGAIPIFLEQMTKWQFCPPSSNLWTIEIVEHNDGDSGNSSNHTLESLYDNIIKVNKQFNTYFSSSYGINALGDTSAAAETANTPAGNFIKSSQVNEIGSFLATDVSFNANSITIVDKASSFSEAFTGWLSYGKIQQGRVHNRAAVIKFYRSNWDINELFFDPWIAAIGQQGLIEGDESDKIYNIKADIYINEYAASSANEQTTSWKLRKQIKLTKAFPKSREQYKYSYSPETAGSFTSAKVDFEFENYSINYKIFDNAKNTFKAKNTQSGKVTGEGRHETGASFIGVNTNTSAAGGASRTNMYQNASGLA
jgi:hypothetical protein